MTDHGDADDDDPQLGGLRSIWLGMADEDPPERGLAELMAAARVKAEEMAQPSLWQRIIAMMRRPPVLALATLTVLVAGAVLVGNRHEKLESRSAPAIEPDRAEGGEATIQPAMTPAPVEPAPAAASSADPGNAPATVETDLKTESAVRPRGGNASPVATGTRRPAAAKAAKASKAGDDLLSEGKGYADEPVKKADTPRDTRPAPEREELQLALPEMPPEVTSAAAGGSRPASTATADAEPAKTQQQQQGVAQLHAQARTAASHDDCAAVKVMVQRIAKQDPAYYRANVTNDAAIAKCTTR